MNVTLLVNTKDRPFFIDRILRYYASVCFDGFIVIADSSCDAVQMSNKQRIDSYKDKLNITYFCLPGANVIEAQSEIISCADTDYVVLNNDDDLYVPNGIERCISFLDEHNDYVAANGIGIMIKMRDTGPYGRILSTSLHPMTNVEEDSALERIMHHLPEYTPALWSVYRKDVFEKTYRNPLVENNFNYDSAVVGELAPACLGCVYGKIRHFDDFLFFFRQIHAERWTSSSYIDWVDSDIFKEDRERFCRYFASVISKVDNRDERFVYSLVNDSFEKYVENNRDRFDLRLNQFLSRIPFVRLPLRIIKDMVLYMNNEYSLGSLLRNHDFSIPYQLITNGGAS